MVGSKLLCFSGQPLIQIGIQSLDLNFTRKWDVPRGYGHAVRRGPAMTFIASTLRVCSRNDRFNANSFFNNGVVAAQTATFSRLYETPFTTPFGDAKWTSQFPRFLVEAQDALQPSQQDFLFLLTGCARHSASNEPPQPRLSQAPAQRSGISSPLRSSIFIRRQPRCKLHYSRRRHLHKQPSLRSSDTSAGPFQARAGMVSRGGTLILGQHHSRE